MARGTALSVLRTYLKAELRDAQETNSPLDTEYNYALASKQKDFSLAYDWEFLKRDWDLSCPTASQYLDIPTVDTRGATATINFERPVKVSRKWGNFWVDITEMYGIGTEQYNLFDGVTQLSDPIQRWQFSTNVNETANPNEIEVWPCCASEQTLRFEGQRVVKALSGDSDTADLDDYLLVYWVAADYLAQRNQANASIMLKKAADHLVKLRAGYPTNTEPVVLGRNLYRTREQVRLVGVARTG